MRVDCSNVVVSQEDDKDPSIWFLDHSYHEAMYAMFKKINAKELVVGWYARTTHASCDESRHRFM